MINLANLDNGLGLVTNIILAVSLAALGNAIIYSQGWDRSAGNVIQPSFAPSGYVVGIVWLFLFAFMGTARWLIIKSNQKATYHSRSVIFLIIFCFLYPFYSLAINSNIGGLIGNIATILLAGWTAYKIKSSSKSASAFVFPVVLWVSFATAIIIRLLQLNA